MSGYYIKTPFVGPWDILHPDNGDHVVARCYDPTDAAKVCEKLNAMLLPPRSVYEAQGQEIIDLKVENDFIRKARQKALEKRDEATERLAALEAANSYLKSDLIEVQAHLATSEKLNEAMKAEIRKHVDNLLLAIQERDQARQEQDKLNFALVAERRINADLRAQKHRRSLYAEEGETLVELSVSFVHYGRLQSKQLDLPDGETFADTAELLCGWAEEFHRTYGDGPWDTYYDMVEDFFNRKVHIGLSDGTLQLIRRF